MHEMELNVADDHVDRHVLRDTYVFHTRTHNRDCAFWAVLPPSVSNLSAAQIQSLQWMEHVFGGHRIDSAVRPNPIKPSRKPSAEVFSLHKGVGYSELLDVLAVSFGESSSPPHTRPYPSGGAIYSGQATIYAKHVDGLEPGSYHYLPRAHQLERLGAKPEVEIEKHMFLAPNEALTDYAFFILYSIMVTRSLAKYGMRGYRLACIEIGSMYQSLIVQSEKVGLRSRVWGGFADEALSIALGIDPRVAWPVIGHFIGRSE